MTDGEAVGIIAAQSIGEPGTQLTMRTFHTGGVAGLDITSGLPRVEELFEARVPKGSAIIAEIDGTVEISRDGDTRRVSITSIEIYQRRVRAARRRSKVLVENGQQVEPGTVLATPPEAQEESDDDGSQALVAADIVARHLRQRRDREGPHRRPLRGARAARLRHPGRLPPPRPRRRSIHAGQPLTEGPLNPQDILRIQGPDKVQIYLVEEVQKVYRSQGVTINDKHIEVIVRQMLRRVRVDVPGDSNLLPGELRRPLRVRDRERSRAGRGRRARDRAARPARGHQGLAEH